jgi:dTMP kinase
MYTGKFITFEGIDGAGKTTYIAGVVDMLRKRGHTVVVTREPGGTELGEKLREMLLHEKMNMETETLLMFAARREHIAQVIEPALLRGDYVISDRFTDSSFAYQGGGRKLDLQKLNILEQWVHPHIQPDITLLFDVPLEIAKQRLDSTRTLDRFEKEKEEFFSATRAEYLRRAEEFSERFWIIDTTQSIESTRANVNNIILSTFEG